jgi:hypothetical protein
MAQGASTHVDHRHLLGCDDGLEGMDQYRGHAHDVAPEVKRHLGNICIMSASDHHDMAGSTGIAFEMARDQPVLYEERCQRGYRAASAESARPCTPGACGQLHHVKARGAA